MYVTDKQSGSEATAAEDVSFDDLTLSLRTKMRAELLKREKIIKQNRNAWQKVPTAFVEIRDFRLYRAEGFADYGYYCKERLHAGKSTINRQIAVGEVYKILASVEAGVLPTSERQIRPLLCLRQAGRTPEVWGVKERDARPPVQRRFHARVALAVVAPAEHPNQFVPGEEYLAVCEAAQPGQLNQTKQNFIVLFGWQAVGVRASDGQLPGNRVARALVVDAVLETQRLHFWLQPMRQRAERKLRQIHFVLRLPVLLWHCIIFDARVRFQVSPLQNGNNLSCCCFDSLENRVKKLVARMLKGFRRLRGNSCVVSR